MPGIAYDQIMRVPYLMGLIAEYNAVGSTFQRTYGLGPMSRPGQVIKGRSGVYDIFNPTRSLPTVRAPMAGPSRVARKPVAQKPVTVMRSYEALVVEDEYVFHLRPLGGQYGEIDELGQSYIARQVGHQMQKYQNLHEFMAINLMRGGWGLKPIGEDLYPVLKDDADATVSVDSLVAADHQGQLALGTGGADIIDVSWDDPAADLVAQFMKLNKIHARLHGAPLKHVWANGDTIAPLFNNTKLQAVGGTAYRIFDSLSGREADPGQRWPDTGVDIVFRALPYMVFHVYNQVVVLDQVSESQSAQLDVANNTYLIPDNEVIITPDPGDWCSLVAGSEPVQYSINEEAKIAIGFDMGRAREIDPPRWDLKFLNNTAPVLTQFNAVYNPTVIFV